MYPSLKYRANKCSFIFKESCGLKKFCSIANTRSFHVLLACMTNYLSDCVSPRLLLVISTSSEPLFLRRNYDINLIFFFVLIPLGVSKTTHSTEASVGIRLSTQNGFQSCSYLCGVPHAFCCSPFEQFNACARKS